VDYSNKTHDETITRLMMMVVKTMRRRRSRHMKVAEKHPD
jgi:hypothetical protein